MKTIKLEIFMTDGNFTSTHSSWNAARRKLASIQKDLRNKYDNFVGEELDRFRRNPANSWQNGGFTNDEPVFPKYKAAKWSIEDTRHCCPLLGPRMATGKFFTE
jgi:hypothetical protein